MQQLWIQVPGSWQNPANWPGGILPAWYDDVFVGDALDPITVTSTANVTINSIGVAENCALVIANDSYFTATDGTNVNWYDEPLIGVGNWGTIDVDSGSTFVVGQALDNVGTLELGQAGNAQLGWLGLKSIVTLSGGGVVDLGVASGGSVSLGGIGGPGLVNVNNTIEGAGTLDGVTSLDNQAAGVIDALYTADSQFGLSMASPTISNEGVINVETNALLSLGLFGFGETLANSNEIYVGYNGGSRESGARIAIAGDFTLTGAGALQFLGADAELTSNGLHPAIFNNESQIYAFATSQIGDQGVLGVNDLTLENEGLIEAVGSGVTLTLNTGANAIGDSGGTIVATADALLRIDSEVVTGAGTGQTYGGTVEVMAGGQLFLSAAIESGLTNDTDYVGAGQVVVEVGGSVTIDAGGSIAIPLEIYGTSGGAAGGVVTVNPGGSISGPVTFETPGARLELADTGASVFGSGGNVYLEYASVNLNGGGNTINFDTYGDLANLAGTGSADTVDGAFGTIELFNAQASVYGGGNVIEFTGGFGTDAVSLYETPTSADTVRGVGGAVDLYTAQADLDANKSHVDFAGNDTLTSNGTNEYFQFGAAMGTSSISGFVSGDTIQFSKMDFTSFTEMLSHTSPFGNAIITDPGVGQLTLEGVNKTSLVASEFVYS